MEFDRESGTLKTRLVLPAWLLENSTCGKCGPFIFQGKPRFGVGRVGEGGYEYLTEGEESEEELKWKLEKEARKTLGREGWV